MAFEKTYEIDLDESRAIARFSLDDDQVSVAFTLPSGAYAAMYDCGMPNASNVFYHKVIRRAVAGGPKLFLIDSRVRSWVEESYTDFLNAYANSAVQEQVSDKAL